MAITRPLEASVKERIEDRAKHFLEIFYSRSRGKEMRLRSSSGLLVVDVVGPNITHSKRQLKTATDRASESFSVAFSFYKKDESIAEVHANGINNETMTAMRQLVDKNPHWSDNEVSATLRRAGARFTPYNRREFIRMIPMRQIAQVFGPARIVSVEFSSRDPLARKEGRPAANLMWRVRAVARANPRNEFYMVFEPFDGALTYFSRTILP
ncbi:MAG: hypothetical protein L0Z53_00015 [Acidobacteriales bacterium]|nr:hypothetical protein [Terriglobales bacterium]